jgi:predicted MFS family arabinose efflux permease
VLSVALGSIALVTNEFLPVALLTSIRTSLHVSEGTAATMVTASAVTAAVSAPVLAIAVGRTDRRAVLIAMAGLFTVSDALAASAPNFAVMIAARFLLGVAVGGFWAAGVALFPAVYQAATALGSLLGGLVVVFGGDSAAMLTGAACAVATLVAFALFARPGRRQPAG